jgi:tripartite-type tricarboxylate transporter receptor subunit TctC
VTAPRRALAALAALALLWSGMAHAAYPDRPITVVVPNQAGGPLDLMARIIAKTLPRYIGQKVIVKNIVGGGTAVGDRAVLNAPADGYTFLFIHQPLMEVAAEGILGAKFTDFVPVARTGGIDQIYVARKGAPFDSFKGMVDWGKDHPGGVRNGVALMANNHFVALAVTQATGVKFKLINVPGGGGPILPALLSDQIDVGFVAPEEVVAYAKTGKIVPLALFGTQRNKLLPNLPTAKELGYPALGNLDVSAYWWARKDVPLQIRNTLADKLEQTMQDPELRKDFEHLTDDLGFTKGEALQHDVDARYAAYEKLVDTFNMRRAAK